MAQKPEMRRLTTPKIICFYVHLSSDSAFTGRLPASILPLPAASQLINFFLFLFFLFFAFLFFLFFIIFIFNCFLSLLFFPLCEVEFLGRQLCLTAWPELVDSFVCCELWASCHPFASSRSLASVPLVPFYFFFRRFTLVF